MTVKMSPKYQVVIPKNVRNALQIKAGSKVQVIAKGNVAYLIPVPTLEDIQKHLAGKLDSKKLRDKSDRNI